MRQTNAPTVLKWRTTGVHLVWNEHSLTINGNKNLPSHCNFDDDQRRRRVYYNFGANTKLTACNLINKKDRWRRKKCSGPSRIQIKEKNCNSHYIFCLSCIIFFSVLQLILTKKRHPLRNPHARTIFHLSVWNVINIANVWHRWLASQIIISNNKKKKVNRQTNSIEKESTYTHKKWKREREAGCVLQTLLLGNCDI